MEFKALCRRAPSCLKRRHHYPQKRGTRKIQREGRVEACHFQHLKNVPSWTANLHFSSVSAEHHASVFAKKTRNVIITGGCVLWLTERCIYPINLGEFCCLMGAQVRGVVETLLRFSHFSVNYLLLLIHGDRTDIACGSPEGFKSDYRSLWVSVEPGWSPWYCRRKGKTQILHPVGKHLVTWLMSQAGLWVLQTQNTLWGRRMAKKG